MTVKTLQEIQTVIINGDVYFKASAINQSIIEGTVVEVITIRDSNKNERHALVLEKVSEGDFGRARLHAPGTKVRIHQVIE